MVSSNQIVLDNYGIQLCSQLKLKKIKFEYCISFGLYLYMTVSGIWATE